MTWILTLLACFEPSDRIVTIMELSGDPEAGAVVYAEHCAGCHGEEAKGGIGPNLVLAMNHSTERFLDWTLYGKEPDMPAYESVLEDQQVADLYAWLELQ